MSASKEGLSRELVVYVKLVHDKPHQLFLFCPSDAMQEVFKFELVPLKLDVFHIFI